MTPAQAKGGAMSGRGWQAMVALLGVVALVLSGCASQSGSAQAGVSSESYGGSGGAAMGMGPDGRPGRGPGMGRGPNPREFVPTVELKDIHFEFDRAEIGSEAATVLDANAQWLKANPSHLVLVEGHADERGTSEYNLALGDRRAKASMNYLIAHGVRANRISIISYGEEQPLCREHTEECWTQNRRAHFGIKAR